MYDGLDMSSVHIARTVEKFHHENLKNVAIYVPSIMPFVVEGKPKEVENRLSKNNIKNKDKSILGISTTIKTANCIRVDLPRLLEYDLPHDSQGMVPVGTELLVIFVEGNPNNIRVIGRWM